MKELWKEKEQITEYSVRTNTIAHTFNNIESVLGYKRKYSNLNQNQLECLLTVAKENEWQALDLSDCRIDQLPNLLWEIKSLRVLYLGNKTLEKQNYNSICEIPDGIGKLENLEALSIRNLPICSVARQFKSLKKLTYLECYECDFEEFPENLTNPNITAIGITINCSKVLKQICKMKKIEELYFANSKIEDLTYEIGNLINLRILYFPNSRIKTIPDTLLNIKNIKVLGLDNTPLEKEIPEEMRMQNAYDLICYICKQQKQNKSYTFNESKMIIVGQGNVGKSCLVERITNNHYEDKTSTEGIDVKKWPYTVSNKEYILNIWDFGGQEIYHSTHQFFLTKRSLYIFVWDARAEEEYGRIDYWLKTIESFADDSPIIIAINKCDKETTRINRIDFKTYKENYQQIRVILDISCKDNYNIKRLKKLIKKEASNLSITKEKWIESWFLIREKLEELSNTYKYISYSKYQKICSEYEIKNEEMKSLSKYLHDLGIILHYQDDLLLRMFIILSPEWATSAVYKILDSQESVLKNRNGILKVNDLPRIWINTKLYPEDKYIFLLKIMEKFQLCFELDKETYLVAELLENESIDLPKGWNLGDDDSIRLIYKYDFMPAGVMTRFIVKVHEYIASEKNKKMCWKKGVYLRYYESYASVIMTDSISEKKIEVRVSKKDNSNHDRELLHLIRNAIKGINGTFKKLKVEEYVPCNCKTKCPYQFQFRTLCKALEAKRSTIQCHESFLDVDIIKILEGIEIMKTEEKSDNLYQMNPTIAPVISPVISPTFTNTVSSENKHSSNQNNVINIVEIKKTVMEIQGDLSEVQDEIDEINVGEIQDDYKKEIHEQIVKIQSDLERIIEMEKPEEIIKSGKLNKLKRLLVNFSDENSDIRKALKGGKNIVLIFGGLMQKFQSIADTLGLNFLPPV